MKKSLAYLAITWLGLAFFVNAATASGTTLDKILDNVEKRYASSGFSAKFDQTSTLRAVQITDTASGKAYFQYPGNMRWEYETPDKQYIITNNDFLWIYSPADNQLMKGNASQYFGDGKGASFLSDISLLRKKFRLSLIEREGTDYYVLQLIPLGQGLDITQAYLWVKSDTFDIIQIITNNSAGDETRIELSEHSFSEKMNESFFNFKAPENAEVIYLNEQ